MLRAIRASVLAVVLVAAAAVGAAPPEVPNEIKARPGQPVRVTVKAAGEIGYLPVFAEDEAFFDELSGKGTARRFIFQASTPGKYSVVFWTKGEVEGVRTVIVVDGTPPGPTPGPTPTPPDPPGPSASPFPLPGLRVLILYESGDLTKLTPGQNSVIFGKTARDLLQSKCVVGPDGKTREYRIYDKDQAPLSDSPTWVNAAARPRPPTLPWLIVGNGKGGYEGPLPGSVAEFVALVNKYAE